MIGLLFADYKEICRHLDKSTDKGPESSLLKLELYTLTLEDRRFFNHRGFDPLSITRVLARRLQGYENPGGASTIEQQYVRTITNRKERNLRRKLREIVLAVLISRKYSKIKILRSYLSIAYLGTYAIGVNEASYNLFRKKPEHLASKEAATIASLLKYPMPGERTPYWEEKVRRRSRYAETVFSKIGHSLIYAHPLPRILRQSGNETDNKIP